MADWTIAKGLSFYVVTTPDGRVVYVAISNGPGKGRKTEAEALAEGKRIFAARDARKK